jgi:plastocyanin
MHKKILTSLAVAGAAAGFAVPALAASKTVKVADDKFVAKTIRISKGTTVVWKWVGKNPHNVTGKGFTSRTVTSGTFKHKFKKRGTFSYRCTIHSGMTGKVVVK